MYALICKIASFRGTNKPENNKPKKLFFWKTSLISIVGKPKVSNILFVLLISDILVFTSDTAWYYHNFTNFTGVGILRKHKFPQSFGLIVKNCGNCAFPQNLHTSKLGETLVFYLAILLVQVETKSWSFYVTSVQFKHVLWN